MALHLGETSGNAVSDGIEQHHLELIQSINEIDCLAHSGPTQAALDRQCIALADASSRTFAAEESAMIQYKYPGFIRHKADHDRFLHRINAFQEQIWQGELGGATAFTQAAREWLLQHIMIADKECEAYLQIRGAR